MPKKPNAGEKIREFRDALGLSRQQDLADLLGVAATAVSAWERGDYEPEAKNYIALGSLALKRGLFDHAAWFWIQAGHSEEDILLMGAHAHGLSGKDLERLRSAGTKVQEESEIPEPPAILPAKWREKWQEEYRRKLEELREDESLKAPAERAQSKQQRKWMALREANRLLRTTECSSYEEAARLEDWQVIFREEKDGKLKVVTIDGKKYVFDVPKKAK